jgi:very-short-patch-repair endonuclease
MEYEKCFLCGKKILLTDSTPPLCDECKESHIGRMKKLAEEKRKINVELMAEKSVEMIAKDKMREADFFRYKKPIESVVSSARKHPEMFDSSEEMAVAIALYQQKKHFRMQVKVGSRRVDVCLPEEKLFIEIDGSRHENREYHDTVRDVEILQAAGDEWEIVHIPASFVNQHPTRVYAKAFTMSSKKREYKKSHGYTIAPEIAKALLYKKTHKTSGALRD